MPATRDALAQLFDRYVEGELTDDEAAQHAQAILADALDLEFDVGAAFWTGRLEEATGTELWPFETRSAA